MRIKSNSIKALNGTLRPDRIKTFEGESIPGAIFPLNKIEESFYQRIKLHLETNSASNEIDCIYISVAARVCGQMVESAKALKLAGSVMTYPNGTRQVSAEWTAFKQNYDTFKDISKVLGLDPKSRLAMDYFINENEDQDDPFAQFLNVN